MIETDQTDLEIAIGNLYVQFYRLRKAGQHQEEYDAMGALVNMLSRDRQHLRENFNINI